LLSKELRLSTSILSWLFLAFAAMTLIPGYPILVGSFFVCLGIFQSFQTIRENNDVLYTVLLPVEKADAVRAKYIFVCFIEILAWLLMAALTALRMTALSGAAAYVSNPMMDANLVYLAYAALVFALFNVIFLGGFFRTGYKFGKPFVIFIVVAMLVVLLAEILHHVPGLDFLNGSNNLGVQAAILAAGLVIYAAATLLSCRRSQRIFGKIDL
jgi:hypothetical protein